MHERLALEDLSRVMMVHGPNLMRARTSHCTWKSNGNKPVQHQLGACPTQPTFQSNISALQDHTSSAALSEDPVDMHDAIVD